MAMAKLLFHCTCHRGHTSTHCTALHEGKAARQRDQVLSCSFLLLLQGERKGLCRLRQQLQSSGCKHRARFQPPPYTPRDLSCWFPTAAAEESQRKNPLLEHPEHRLAQGWGGRHRSDSHWSGPALAHRALQSPRGS